MGKITVSSNNIIELPLGLEGNDDSYHDDSEEDYRTPEIPGGNKLIIQNDFETEQIISDKLQIFIKYVSNIQEKKARNQLHHQLEGLLNKSKRKI